MGDNRTTRTCYSIDRGLLRPPLEVEIDGVPPCLFCGESVTSPSMGGPLVCASCDCGRNPDGSRWTADQADERRVHYQSKIAEYQALTLTRQVDALRAACGGIRAAIERLRPEDIRALRSLIDDPRRSCGGANQGDYERYALPTLLAALPDLFAVYEEDVRLLGLLDGTDDRVKEVP